MTNKQKEGCLRAAYTKKKWLMRVVLLKNPFGFQVFSGLVIFCLKKYRFKKKLYSIFKPCLN